MTVGWCHTGINQKPRAVLHKRVSEKAEPRFHTMSLAVEPGLGIGRARMCGVGPPLAAKVRLEIAAANWWRWMVGILVDRLETLHRGPGLNKRAIDAEVLGGSHRNHGGQRRRGSD